MKLLTRLRRLLRRNLRLKDLGGHDIREGDTVLAFVVHYPSELDEEASAGGIPVYFEDTSKPPSIPDTPVFRGVVVWDAHMLAYEVAVDWTNHGWTDACARRMGGGGYVYQIIDPSDPRPG